MFHDFSKHIDICYHFMKDRVQKGVVSLDYIPTELQVANIPTNPLVKGKFGMLREYTIVCENTFLINREY
jgi:hypothetical protein